ncbi:TolB family protein [Maricaulis sp.]|uniref:TolB family protein n=1 Tax=Maricaulis sp. TaxID=1486257 RepID=UPI003A9074BD
MRHYLALAAATGLIACSPDGTGTRAPAAEAPAEQQAPAAPVVERDAAAPAEETSGLPGTDIRIFALDWVDGRPQIGAPAGGVIRPGYDNQPFFTPDGTGLLYTAGDDASGETDIWRLDLASGETAPVTRTPDESEYSPRVPPGEAELSYIYQPPGGYAGNAYLANADNSDRRAAEDLAPVGYYLFSGDMRHVVTFALGEPNTLQLIDRSVEPEIVQAVADNPGASLARTLHGDGAWVTLERADGGFAVHRLDFASGRLRAGFDLPGMEPHFARITSPVSGMFAFDGFFSTADGTLFYGTVPADAAATTRSPAWVEIASLSGLGLNGVTRIAVSADADRIAVVVADQD